MLDETAARVNAGASIPHSPSTGGGGSATPALPAPARSAPRSAQRFALRSDAQFVADVSRTARREFHVHAGLVPARAPLPNEDNYNAPAVIEEYSIVDNFLQQEFVKILAELRPQILARVDRFFREINCVFPVIRDRDYFLAKVHELVQSIAVCNFPTNVINDEHNLCIVYKVILICMLYTQDRALETRYLKTTRHLLSRFECLDPINTLKCYLLTHLYAQLARDQPLVVRMNGLVASLALDLRLHRAARDPLKRQLWHVCYCFDFFVTDPLYREFGLGPDAHVRLIHDHSTLVAAPDAPLLQILDIKRKVYDGHLDPDQGVELLLALDELTAKAAFHMPAEDADFDFDFRTALHVLYFLETLLLFQRSLVPDWDAASIAKNPTLLRHVKTLVLFTHRFVAIWHSNLKIHHCIPFVSLSKLFQTGLFINWYVSQDFPQTHDNPLPILSLNALQSTALKRTQSAPSSMAPHTKKSGYKYLVMVMEIMQTYAPVDEKVQQYQNVLRSVFLQTDFADPTVAVSMDHLSDTLLATDKLGVSSEVAALEMPTSFLDHKSNTCISSTNMRGLERNLKAGARYNPRDTNHYSLFNLNSTSVPNFTNLKHSGLRDDFVNSSQSSLHETPLSTNHSSPRKVNSHSDLVCNTSVEEQLNNFVSGFTFDNRAKPGVIQYPQDKISRLTPSTTDDSVHAESRTQPNGEIFKTLEDLIDTKKNNDVYHMNF